MAVDYNAPGQNHENRYVRPKGDVPLRYCDGRWTGYVITQEQLVYTGSKAGEAFYNGRLRLDVHEILERVPIEGRGVTGRMVFHRGGHGYVDSYHVKYGFVWIADLLDSPGTPVPAGDHRGEDPGAYRNLYRLKVTRIPTTALYKPSNPGSTWATYGDSGDREAEGAPGLRYTYLCWSFLNVAGGGHARSCLPDGLLIRECDVPRIKAPAYDMAGNNIGWVQGAYVRVTAGGTKQHGWMVWAHKLGANPVVYHATPA